MSNQDESPLDRSAQTAGHNAAGHNAAGHNAALSALSRGLPDAPSRAGDASHSAPSATPRPASSSEKTVVRGDGPLPGSASNGSTPRGTLSTSGKIESRNQRGTTSDSDPAKVTPQGANPPSATPPNELAETLLGSRLEHFELLEYVGGGGMGDVFRANDTRLKRTVALKVLSRQAAARTETLQRFRVEAESAARLDHEGIARVFHIGEDRGFHFLALEFIEGDNLRDLVQRDGPLPWERVLDLAFQISRAIEHANERDVVHRDIKPSNVLVTTDGRTKLVDMGLARLNLVDSEIDLTNSGATLGTFDYISPEQAQDPRTADVRSDMYSLGCTLYYLLSGHPPFPDGTMLQKLLKHQGTEPADIRELRPEIPSAIAQLLNKLLAKSPRLRPQSPREFLTDLTEAADALDVSLAESSGEYRVVEPLWMSLTRQHAHWLVPVIALVFCIVVLDVVWSRSANPQATVPYSPLDDPAVLIAQPVQVNAHGAVPHTALARSSENPRLDSTFPGRFEGDSFPSSGMGPATSSAANASTGSQANGETGMPVDSRIARGGGPSFDPTSSDVPHDFNPGFEIPRVDLTNSFPPRNSLANDAGANPAGGVLAHSNQPPFDHGEVANSDDSGPGPNANQNTQQDNQQLADTSTGQPQIRPPGMGQKLYVNPFMDGGALSAAQSHGGQILEFPTLKSALEAARGGDQIELKFNGRLVESSPILLPDANLTIKAADGFRPVVVFHPDMDDVGLIPTSMMIIRGERLRIFGVAFELDLSDIQSVSGWSLFEIGRGALSLDDCWLTIVNGQDHPYAYAGLRRNDKVQFVRVRSEQPPGQLIAPTESDDPMGVIATTRIELSDCVARGEASLVASRGAPTSITWHNGILATSEFLLVGEIDAPARVTPFFSLDLRHLTAKLGGGLVQLNSRVAHTSSDRLLNADCEDCIFIGDVNSVLISQTGIEDPARQQNHVQWLDHGVFYQAFDLYWEILNQFTQEKPHQIGSEEWGFFWPGSSGPMSGNQAYFASPTDQGAPYFRHSLAAYLLADYIDNGAVGSGPDGADGGADFDLLSDPPSEKHAAR